MFEAAHALDRLEQFATFNGADFYGLARNSERITLVKNPWQVAEAIAVGTDAVIPFRIGEIITWQLIEENK